MNKPVLFCCILAVIFMTGCDIGSVTGNPAVARVNGKVLRKSVFLSETEDYSQAQKTQYVDNWIQHQIWLESAGNYRLSRQEKNKINRYKEDLKIAAYKQSLRSKIVVSEKEILEYYRDSRSSFALKSDHIFAGIFTYASKNEADDAYKKISGGGQNSLSRKEYRLYSLTDLPKELAGVLKNKQNNSWLKPEKHGSIYFIVHVVKHYSENDIPELEHLRTKIEDQIRIQKYFRIHDKKFKELKESSNVKIF